MLQAADLLNTFGVWLVRNLWRVSAELAVLAAAVLAAIHVLRISSPRLRHLFWGLVLAKPVVTLLVASPVSLYWFLRPAAPAAAPPTVSMVQAPVTRPRYGRVYRRPPQAMERGPAAAPATVPAWWRTINAHGTAALVWLACAGALALRLIVGFAFVSFLLRTAAVQTTGPPCEAVAEAAAALGVTRRVRVAVSAVAHGPVLAGVFRPVILLPRSVATEFSPEQIKLIVAHELAHVRRLDNLVLLVQRLAEVLLFFHPVVWLCGWMMRREAEAACDDAVLGAYGGADAAYADSLTRVAEMANGSRSALTRRLLANTFAAAESHFSRRVRRILRGRAGRMGLGLTAVSILVLIVLTCLGLPSAAERKARASAPPGREAQGETMNDQRESLRYGFRYDPMEFVRNSTTLQAALVRTFVLEKPKADDPGIIRRRIDELLAEQREDGSFADTSKDTGAKLLELLEMGLDPGGKEARRAAEAILRQKRNGENAGEWIEKEGCMSVYALHALCLLDMRGEPEVPWSLRWLAANQDQYVGFTVGCPWTPEVFLRALWAGRSIEPVEDAVVGGLDWFHEHMNDAGCVGWKEPWGVLDCAGYIDHPVARRLVVKQMPMILRGQQEDGGWGDRSVSVFRALVTHGLLDELRGRPPLPEDWRVVRSIPAPDGDLSTLVWDGRLLWTCDRAGKRAIGVSPQDGSVVKSVPLPVTRTHGIGRWGDALAVTDAESKRVLRINTETGEVEQEIGLGFMEWVMGATEIGGRLWIADGFLFPGRTLDPANPAGRGYLDRLLAGPGPMDFAATPDGVWHIDFWAPAMLKSGRGGRLLEWGAKPFDGATMGITWDGENLWLLDNKQRRLCVVERTETAPRVRQSPAAAGRPDANVRSSDGRTRTAMHARVTRDGDGTRIEGVPTLGWGKDRECTFAGALEAALAATDRPMRYSDIMGFTGLAFRVRWYHGDTGQRWCPSSPVGEFPEEWRAAEAAIGWRLREEVRLDRDEPHMEEFVPDIVASVNRGLPVLAYEPRLNMDVVYGYRDGGKALLLRDYFKGEEPLELPAEGLGPMLGFLEDRTDPLPRREAILRGLRTAARNWRRQQEPAERGKYWHGTAALTKWADDLGKVDGLSQEERGLLFFVSHWNFGSLVDARQAAVAFLRESASVLGEDAGAAVGRAADQYQREVDLLTRAMRDRNAFLGQWSGKSIADWTDEVREREAAMLRQAEEIEGDAISEIEKALKAAGVEDVEVPSAVGRAAADRSIVLAVGNPGGEHVMHASVRREGGKVWIEGMENVDWGGSFFRRQDSQVACITEVLRCAGQDVTYADVMGLSGAAFKLTMEPNLFVAEIHSEMGMDWTEIMSRIWGVDYDSTAISLNQEENPGWREELHQAAVESIGRGVPLFYMNGEWNLLVGYREDGTAFVCKPYAGDEKGYQDSEVPGGFLGDAWFASVLRPGGEPADRRESVVQSLQAALELATRPAEENGERLYGFAAYEAWIAALEGNREDASKHGNAFSYSQLLTSRQGAGDHLLKVADEFGGEAAPHLKAAADRYLRIAQRLWDGRDCVEHPWEESWTPENRAVEAGLLRECLALEKEAVSQIRRALEAEDIDVPAPASPVAESAEAGGRSESRNASGRAMLDGVPRVRYMEDGLCPFALCLKSLTDYLGKHHAYRDILGISGACFRMTWNTRQWDEGNMDLGKLGGAAPFRRGVQSVGYRPRFMVRASWWPDETSEDVELLSDDRKAEALWRSSIIQSIDKRTPVLAFGVVGPPEVSIVTGYDEGGDVLIGWSCFQDDLPEDQREPGGEFRQRDWFGNTQGIIILEGQLPDSEADRVHRDALDWAYRVMTLPRTGADVHGSAAYEGWAEGMRKDEAFPEGDEQALQRRRHTVWDGLIMLAERGTAADFLESQAENRPDAAEHLRRAARALREEGEYSNRINAALGGPWLPSDHLSDPDARRRAAALILEARDRNVEAAGHMARALGTLGLWPEETSSPAAGD